jgi:hypothetical protein
VFVLCVEVCDAAPVASERLEDARRLSESTRFLHVRIEIGEAHLFVASIQMAWHAQVCFDEFRETISRRMIDREAHTTDRTQRTTARHNLRVTEFAHQMTVI